MLTSRCFSSYLLSIAVEQLALPSQTDRVFEIIHLISQSIEPFAGQPVVAPAFIFSFERHFLDQVIFTQQLYGSIQSSGAWPYLTQAVLFYLLRQFVPMAWFQTQREQNAECHLR